MARSSFHRGRVAAGGRAARIVRRAQWRDECPPSKGYVFVGNAVVKHYRTPFHVWMIAKGLRHRTFQIRRRAGVS